jgi:hypothetical protein
MKRPLDSVWFFLFSYLKFCSEKVNNAAVDVNFFSDLIPFLGLRAAQDLTKVYR